jgi:hypothetical protein
MAVNGLFFVALLIIALIISVILFFYAIAKKKMTQFWIALLLAFISLILFFAFGLKILIEFGINLFETYR